MKTKHILISLVIMSLAAACAPATPIEPTPDVNAIRTSAAYTVVAEITLAASLFTPTTQPATETPTLEPATETPTNGLTSDPTQAALGTPAALCDDYSLDPLTVDVTIPDGTPMTANQDFVKTWKIKNTGICTWGDGYSLIYSYGDRMSGKPIPLTSVVQPDQEIEVSVNLKAPGQVGEYLGAWQMVNPTGFSFGTKEDILTVKIVVQ